ncbi:hypothetical protein AK812_SmicGene200 [Symbiodinium microadriaticum]|uniref:Uncharacterized protein n=1 Tax=Symbiodinium microadriaticum TaxID=2951 RepID=A0A1Q9F787_SYMMI|nr:hypothetical protein AK812_SmicGene200 [Symbiodinium microadriaticum]
MMTCTILQRGCSAAGFLPALLSRPSMASKGGQLRGSEPREHVNPSAAAALKPRVDPGGGRVRYRFLCHLRRPHLLGALSARRCRCTSCGKGLQLFRTFSSYVARPRRGAVSAVRRRWQRGIAEGTASLRMRWGTEILTERPLLLARGRGYLRAADADPRLVEIAHAHRLGDGTRLAAYVAFRQPRPQQRKLVAASRIPVKQLQDHKQKEVLGFWRDGLEESDPLARAIHEENRLGIEAFLEVTEAVKDIAATSGTVAGRMQPGSRSAAHRELGCEFLGWPPGVLSDGKSQFYGHGYPKGKKKWEAQCLLAEGIRKRGEEITVSMVEGKLVIFFAAPRADLASRKAPENEHLIHVRIVWGDSSEWRAVDSMAWRRIIQSIEGELHSEELLLLRWLWLMMTCMLGLILGFMLGFLMSFLGCTDGNTGVCVTGLTFAGVFVCSLVCMVTGFFGLNAPAPEDPVQRQRLPCRHMGLTLLWELVSNRVSVGRYGNAVFERIHVLVPQLAASNPNMKLDIINVQIGNGPAQFDLRVTLRKPGESVEPQEKIPQKPQVPTSPISADLVALPKALPTNWVNQDISAGDMFQMLLDQTFKADADAASPEAHGGSVATCEVLASLPVLDGKINEPTYQTHRPTTYPPAYLPTCLPAYPTDWSRVLILQFLFLFERGITDGGFRLDFSGSHECSSKADEYSTDGEGIYEGVFAMILCRVACGELLRMLSATAGPDSRAVEQALAGKVLGDREASVGTYREFVVFDSTQIYPEYALWVRHFFRGFKEPLQAQQQRNRCSFAAPATPQSFKTSQGGLGAVNWALISKQLPVLSKGGGGGWPTLGTMLDTLLLQPKASRSVGVFVHFTAVQRNLRLAGVQQEGGGILGCCPCSRCTTDGEEADERIRYLLEKMAAALATRPPSDSSTTTAQDCLKELDQLRPEMTVPGTVALNVEQRQPDIDLPSPDFLLIEDRLEKVYSLVKDQHELLAKYRRQKETAETAPVESPAGYTLPEQQKVSLLYRGVPGSRKRPGMPPTWEAFWFGDSGPPNGPALSRAMGNHIACCGNAQNAEEPTDMTTAPVPEQGNEEEPVIFPSSQGAKGKGVIEVLRTHARTHGQTDGRTDGRT